MSRRKRKLPPTSVAAPTATAARKASDASTTASKLRPWLLAAATALLVARTLWPSEAVAEQGDGAAAVMLWLVLLAGWLLTEALMPRFTLRWSAIDLAVGVLITLTSASALHGATVGAPRPSVNMLWEWIGFGAAYFLMRQLIGSRREARAIVAVMIALAVTLSSFGLYQYFHDMPATRARYAADPDAMLREAGEWYPPGSRERQLFEQRLASTEPMATFGLTNSLAGVLATWLVALAVVAASLPAMPQRRTLVGLAVIVAGGVIAFCLVLTKSRSAYVATAVGVASLVAATAWQRRRRSSRVLLGVAIAAVLLLAVGVAVGGIDAEVLSEAPKSLGYRLQYWRSTAAMIGDEPLWGVGPGNFGDEYTRYKLPVASEEITDPHNFLLEVAATAGLPALFALLVVLVLFAHLVWRGC
ncbi:MAG: O-antigen ligase family protein, partial [Planctomycetales bacterium]|nr:O-antigen ligase family protein [Planctomycetales bacterium]